MLLMLSKAARMEQLAIQKVKRAIWIRSFQKLMSLNHLASGHCCLRELGSSWKACRDSVAFARNC
jgi:hypothetical protein